MQDLHPILVHFPVALIPITMLLGLWSLMQRRSHGLRHAYRFCLLICVVFALGAFLTGHQAADRAEKVVPHALLEAHEDLGAMTFWLILAAGLFELLSALPPVSAWRVPVQALAFIIVVASLITVALAGHRGAEMVYRYGAGVGSVFTPPAQPADSIAQPPEELEPVEGG